MNHTFLTVFYHIFQIFKKIFCVKSTLYYTNIWTYEFGHVVDLVDGLKQQVRFSETVYDAAQPRLFLDLL